MLIILGNRRAECEFAPGYFYGAATPGWSVFIGRTPRLASAEPWLWRVPIPDGIKGRFFIWRFILEKITSLSALPQSDAERIDGAIAHLQASLGDNTHASLEG